MMKAWLPYFTLACLACTNMLCLHKYAFLLFEWGTLKALLSVWDRLRLKMGMLFAYSWACPPHLGLFNSYTG